ncbi:MAG: aldehyde dehydrogenase family protein [Gammaproteobacteria bacterium]|jgi:acyl-CoA reductase-like NAD-dependent aldehyde dehydrogenase|nr:aldehyde dehydrogenase family protein [Gammaproteobacteria bacterium]MBT3489026.1 aldehyde dehydrogenase family protein [Gammaproteobacteria bacterium]MBT3719168.1 aldehyde dehydrogenase family protein [Gammaproteobacteria bacterium]MBT3844992.1 aldehyde dehydrogenase family protein [Gammaproteobacteria bacterium]MBT3892784.1 aldehyde dehydrogenase family protein [Gammaproteobacteria bacterium]
MRHIKLDYPTKTSDTIEVTCPYDGETIATVEVADASIVEQALTTANNLFKDRKRWLPQPRRVEILQRVAELMKERAEALAQDAAAEGGKPLLDSRVEVARAIDGINICIETLRSGGGEVIPMDVNAASAGRLAFTSHEPIGVVVAVSAFNHPLNLIVHQVGPAIAAGCPVVVKPAKNTPISCFNFVDLLREAGLPAEWCQPLVIRESAISTSLVSDQRVGFFSFIGSARVGWMLRSKLAPGTRCALEHGGVGPVIVAEDAELEDALPKLVKGGLYHAGQVCVSVQRVFAHESIARELALKIAAEAKQLVVGDPLKEETEVGPLIQPAEVERVNQWVNEALAEGAELLAGGEPLTESCYSCTVLYNPASESKVSQQEIFGPVISVTPYSDIDEAIAKANALPYAFQAAVFTQKIDSALHAYRNLDASAVMVNDHTAFRVDWMPFAGLRQSGLGVGGIPHTLHDMQVSKMIVMNG